MIRLAITGGIAEGKSTVLEVLRTEGLQVASADSIVADLWRQPAVLDSLGELLEMSEPPTRESVRSRIAMSVETRRLVNSFFHPIVWDAIEATRADAVEVPLLVEAVLFGRFQRVWVVTCGPELQRERLVARVGEASADRLIATQLPTRAKIPFADELIRTNQPIERVITATQQALLRLS